MATPVQTTPKAKRNERSTLWTIIVVVSFVVLAYAAYHAFRSTENAYLTQSGSDVSTEEGLAVPQGTITSGAPATNTESTEGNGAS